MIAELLQQAQPLPAADISSPSPCSLSSLAKQLSSGCGWDVQFSMCHLTNLVLHQFLLLLLLVVGPAACHPLVSRLLAMLLPLLLLPLLLLCCQLGNIWFIRGVAKLNHSSRILQRHHRCFNSIQQDSVFQTDINTHYAMLSINLCYKQLLPGSSAGQNQLKPPC
jgi:hypothetical protein